MGNGNVTRWYLMISMESFRGEQDASATRSLSFPLTKVFPVKTKINSANGSVRFLEAEEINGNPSVGCTSLINRKKSQYGVAGQENFRGDLSFCVRAKGFGPSYQKFLSFHGVMYGFHTANSRFTRFRVKVRAG